MSNDQSGAFNYHIQHPPKRLLHTGASSKPIPNKPKDGIQRHTKSTNPIIRTLAKITTDKTSTSDKT